MSPRLAPARIAATLLLWPLTCLGQNGDLESALEQVRQLERQRQFSEAIQTAETALKKTEERVAIDDPQRIELIGLLAENQSLDNRGAAAADLLERTLHDLEQHDSTTLAVANISLKLAPIYALLGRPAKAEEIAAKAVQNCRVRLTPDDPQFASALLTLALQKRAMGKTHDELPLLKQALRIVANPQSPDAAGTLKLTLLQLASFYDRAGEPDKAASYRARAAAVTVSEVSDEFSALSDTGMRALKKGDFLEASRSFQQLVKAAGQRYGENGPATIIAKQQLATAYLALRQREKAKPVIIDLLESVHADYICSLPLMNEEEFLDAAQSAELRFSIFASYVHDFHTFDPDLAGRMYDSALWIKGAVLENAAAVQAHLRSSRSAEVQQLFTELENQRNLYRVAATSPTHPDAYRIRSKVLALEHQIVAMIGLPASPTITWGDVKRHLRAGEAAVEVLRFPYFNGRESSAMAYYAALVLRPELPTPIYVYLGDNTEVEDRAASTYARYVSRDITDQDRRWTPAFWTSLADSLGNARRIYVSPDGVLNNVSFPAIRNIDGKPLIESYDIRTVSSTRDLVRDKSPTRGGTATAFLVGDPDFDRSQEAGDHVGGAFACDSLLGITTAAALRSSSCPPDAQFCRLKETATEIQNVGRVLCQHHWKISAVTGDRASKQSIEEGAAMQPRVLHIATHGFFRATKGESGPTNTPTRIDKAMLEAGLVFAGANNAMRHEKSSDNVRSSVWTAYEISSLDLRGTDVAVLSACKTGLADTLTGGEVFGLRRAFQIAGVDGVLMSMWSVPENRQTSELLTSFYEGWLAGKDKYSALRDAQINVRRVVIEKYGEDIPFYWGGFVLVAR